MYFHHSLTALNANFILFHSRKCHAKLNIISLAALFIGHNFFSEILINISDKQWMNGQDVEEQNNERATGWLYGFGNDK